MASSIKISELELTEKINLTDIIPIIQGGENRQVTLQYVMDMFYPVGSFLICANSPAIFGNWQNVGTYQSTLSYFHSSDEYNHFYKRSLCDVKCEYGDYTLYVEGFDLLG